MCCFRCVVYIYITLKSSIVIQTSKLHDTAIFRNVQMFRLTRHDAARGHRTELHEISEGALAEMGRWCRNDGETEQNLMGQKTTNGVWSILLTRSLLLHRLFKGSSFSVRVVSFFRCGTRCCVNLYCMILAMSFYTRCCMKMYEVMTWKLNTEPLMSSFFLVHILLMNIEEQTGLYLVDISYRNPGVTGPKWFPWTLESMCF